MTWTPQRAEAWSEFYHSVHAWEAVVRSVARELDKPSSDPTKKHMWGMMEELSSASALVHKKADAYDAETRRDHGITPEEAA